MRSLGLHESGKRYFKKEGMSFFVIDAICVERCFQEMLGMKIQFV